MKGSEGGQLRETLGDLVTVLTATLLLKKLQRKVPKEYSRYTRRFHYDFGKFQKGFFRDGPGKGGKDRRRLETGMKA
jgi:hypothetical protein